MRLIPTSLSSTTVREAVRIALIPAVLMIAAALAA